MNNITRPQLRALALLAEVEGACFVSLFDYVSTPTWNACVARGWAVAPNADRPGNLSLTEAGRAALAAASATLDVAGRNWLERAVKASKG